MSGVVYSIGFKKIEPIYIGSTINEPSRRRDHIMELRAGRHHCRALQNAYNEFGEVDLTYAVLERVEDSIFLRPREYMWLQRMAGALLNSRPNSVSPHPEVSEEIRLKQRERMIGNKIRLGKKMPDEYSDYLSARMKGNQIRLGLPHTDDDREKIRQGLIRAYANGRVRPTGFHAAGAIHNARVKAASLLRKARFIELQAQGKTTAEMADEIGISRDTISHYKELLKKGKLI